MTDGQGHAEGEDAPTPVAITPRSPWPSSQEQVTGDLASFGRTLLLAVLGGGALFVTIVTLADVLVRRKDLDRRRPWRGSIALTV